MEHTPSTNSHPVSYKIRGSWSSPNDEMRGVVLAAVVSMGAVFVLVGWVQALFVGLIFLPFYAPWWTSQKLSGISFLLYKLEARRNRLRGGKIYSRNLGDAVLSFDENTHTMEPIAKTSSHPVTLLSFRPAGQDYRMAFLRRKQGSRDDLIAVVLYHGTHAIVSSSQMRRYFKDRMIVAALKKAVAMTTQDITFSQFVIRRRANPFEQVQHYDDRVHDDFKNPAPGSGEEAAVNQSRLEADYIYSQGDNPVAGIAFRMPFPREWRKRDLNTLTEPEIRAADIMKVVNTFINNVKTVAPNTKLATLFKLVEVAFMLYNANVEDMLPFWAQLQKDVKAEEREELEDVEDALTLRRGPFPTHLSLHHDHLLANRTYHASLMISKVEGKFEPGFLDSLYKMPYDFVYARLSHTADYTKELKKVKRSRLGWGFLEGLLSWGRDKDSDLHPEAAEKEQAIREDQYRLHESRSRATSSRTQIIMQGSSCDEAQSALAAAASEAVVHSCENFQMLGATEHSQHEPLLSALAAVAEM